MSLKSSILMPILSARSISQGMSPSSRPAGDGRAFCKLAFGRRVEGRTAHFPLFDFLLLHLVPDALSVGLLELVAGDLVLSSELPLALLARELRLGLGRRTALDLGLHHLDALLALVPRRPRVKRPKVAVAPEAALFAVHQRGVALRVLLFRIGTLLQQFFHEGDVVVEDGEVQERRPYEPRAVARRTASATRAGRRDAPCQSLLSTSMFLPSVSLSANRGSSSHLFKYAMNSSGF